MPRRQRRQDSRTLQDMTFEEAKNLAAAIVQNLGTQNIEDYVARGRPLAALSDEELKQHCVFSYKMWATNPLDPAHCRQTGDADVEYQLRGQFPPYELVMDDVEKLCALAR